MATIAYFHDGTSIYDELFLEHLTKRNNVDFLTFNAKPRFISKARAIIMREPPHLWADKEWMEGIRMYALFPLRSLLIRLQLRRIKPQLVIGCMATKYGFYSAVAQARPTVVIVWGSDVLLAPKHFFFRFMSKYSLKKADAVILDSQVQQEAAIQLGCNPSKILKFPWFDLEDTHPQNSKDEIRDRLGWKDNIIIINTRSHEPVYGVEHLIAAIPEVIRNEPKSRFLMLGKGSLTDNLRHKVKQLHVSEYVKFIGSVPRKEVVNYMNASDIYVSTSFSDGTSASLLEAMSLALPCVVTNISGNKEWIINDKNGCLVPLGDPKTLAQDIVSLIHNREFRRKLGENAQKTVQAKLNWGKNMESLDRLIEELIRKKFEE